MPDLTDFLLARISEDQETAERLDLCPYAGGDPGNGAVHLSSSRVLAECESKRRIIERWKDLTYEVEQAESRGDYDAAPVATAFAYEQVIEILATVYANHADYPEPWRVE